MFCQNCGSPVPDGSAFCPQCGSRVNNVQNETTNTYPQPPSAVYSEPVSSPYQRTTVELPDSGVVNAYPEQEIQYAQPQRSVNSILAGALTAVSILLVAACVLLFIKPGYLRQVETEPPHDDNDVSSVSSHHKNESSKLYDGTSTEKEDDVSENEDRSDIDSSKNSSVITSSGKATSSKYTSSRITSSKKAVSSKATSSKKASASSKVTSSKKAASSKAASSKASSSKAASSKVTSSKAVSSAAPKTESVPVKTESKPESKPDTPIASEPETNEDEQAYNEALVYSTEQRPKFEEFEWCYGQYGLVYDMPPTAYKLTNDLGFNGGWKCMVIYNPTNISGTYIRELNNVTMYVQNGIVDLVMDWYMISNDIYAEPENEEDMKDTVYNGFAMNGGVSVSNTELNSAIVFTSFWKEGGYEYAVGTLQLSDGTLAYVALYR